MLITEITSTFIAGNGGDGKVSFYKERRGPDGGNGGDGGSIYVVATTDLYALSDLSKSTHIHAENGEPGGQKRKEGKNGEDREVKVPVGTSITDKNNHEVFEITNKNSRFLICHGGRGGLGNWEYRSAQNN